MELRFHSFTIEIHFMRAAKFFPFEMQEGRLLVAMADPLDFETLDSIHLASGLEPVPHLALEAEVLDAIEKSYARASRQG